MADVSSKPTARIAIAAALGLAAAGLFALALTLRQPAQEAEPEAAAATAAQPAGAAQPAAAPATQAASLAPSVDLVRVAPDGATLVAGRAAPGAEIALRAGDRTLATADADASGAFVADFAAGPETPRDLTVASRAPGADWAETALVLPEPEGGFLPAAGGEAAVAPPAGTASEPIANVDEGGAGSEAGAAGPVAPEALAAEPPEVPAAAIALAPPGMEPTTAAPTEAPAAAAPASEPAPPSPAAAPRPVAAPAPEARPARAEAASVVVTPGATLWSLARAHYGAGRRYPLIFDANRGEIADPALIFPGQRLRLPPPSDE